MAPLCEIWGAGAPSPHQLGKRSNGFSLRALAASVRPVPARRWPVPGMVSAVLAPWAAPRGGRPACLY